MKEPIVIRQSRSFRIFLWIVTGIVFLLTIWDFTADTVCGMLMGLVLIFAVIGLLGAESWCIILNEEGIRHGRQYHTHHQIQDIQLRYYQGENTQVLTVFFSDGNRLRFRMDCENAPEAKRFLNKRHSIN